MPSSANRIAWTPAVRAAAAWVLCTVLAACSGGGDHAAAGQPREHLDGEGALEAQGDDEIGQVVDAAAGLTRTLGGVPLCNRRGDVSTLEGIEPARLLGDIRIDFVGVRDARYRRADAGPGEPETLAPSLPGRLAREDFHVPGGFEVRRSCDDLPEFVEVALEFTFTSGRGGVIDGLRVGYRDEDGRRLSFVVHRIVVGCGSGGLEPRFEEICDNRST
jgi:hypothetical protein